jgi:hypothetical protein
VRGRSNAGCSSSCGGRALLALVCAWWVASVGACLNPRPEELPSNTLDGAAAAPGAAATPAPDFAAPTAAEAAPAEEADINANSLPAEPPEEDRDSPVRRAQPPGDAGADAGIDAGDE